jgi:predicted phage terminase large subunit-like protein
VIRPATRPASRDELLAAILRTDLPGFVQKVFTVVSPGEPLSFNWHIAAIAHALEKVLRGETRRLIITVPPRHLKSICSSVALPAFVLGHDPTRRIICVSYAQELSTKHANDTRAVMQSGWYRRLFPRTVIDPAKNTEGEVMTTSRGFRLATSVGGTLTGRGGNLIIIDDPIKPADAMSESARERVKHWYETTLLSRLDNKANDAIILVMQLPDRTDNDLLVISWDTAMNATQLSDYSVATVWLFRGELIYYLVDLYRARLDYPALLRKAMELRMRWPEATMLVEDAGSGTSLLQDLRFRNIPAIGIRPEGDKVLRMSAQSAKIESRAVYVPKRAPWLDDLRTELLAFPHGTHDDQVDSISQALGWMQKRYADRPVFGSV